MVVLVTTNTVKITIANTASYTSANSNSSTRTTTMTGARTSSLSVSTTTKPVPMAVAVPLLLSTQFRFFVVRRSHSQNFGKMWKNARILPCRPRFRNFIVGFPQNLKPLNEPKIQQKTKKISVAEPIGAHLLI
jgi:hypothetical protein